MHIKLLYSQISVFLILAGTNRRYFPVKIYFYKVHFDSAFNISYNFKDSKLRIEHSLMSGFRYRLWNLIFHNSFLAIDFLSYSQCSAFLATKLTQLYLVLIIDRWSEQ